MIVPDSVDRIARAVLYEGYLLYPYRLSALKNRQRWNFGVLYPPAWTANRAGSDRSSFQMECLALGSEAAQLEISLRFLRLAADAESIEEEIGTGAMPLADLAAPSVQPFSAGLLRGEIEVTAERVRPDIFRVTVRAGNTTDCAAADHDAALRHSLISAHVVARIHNGKFASVIDPPEDLRELSDSCRNTGVWPVLVGNPKARDTMLGSPIILYDFPQVAPESAGDLFDATEIDEILSLRILTLTEEEKAELRRSDEHARLILDRLESSPPEHLLQLHGTIRSAERSTDAWSAWDTLDGAPATHAIVSGIELTKGSRVRVHPRKRADIFDSLLDGKVAIIEAIEEDFEHHLHFAVVFEDDPGRDLGELRQAGHRFFFSPEEVEPLEAASTGEWP